MEIIRIPRIVQDTCMKYRMQGRSIGLVPTMGALHEGHLSLVRRARQENDIAVVSIFVNPAQFGPSEDFEKYPRDIESDTEKLRSEDIDLLFLPETSLMYREDFSTHVSVDGISEKLCGKFRPGHFSGVATVVAKLFNIIPATSTYFGQKDFQQTVVIRRMAKDLNFDASIIICPTVREENGLAKSSRNLYLSPDERSAACVLYKCLHEASEVVKAGMKDAAHVRELMKDILGGEPLVSKVDYASVYDTETLDEVTSIERDVVIAAAIHIGKTRLIDNMIVMR